MVNTYQSGEDAERTQMFFACSNLGDEHCLYSIRDLCQGKELNRGECIQWWRHLWLLLYIVSVVLTDL